MFLYRFSLRFLRLKWLSLLENDLKTFHGVFSRIDIYEISFSLQGTTTIWPQKYQSINESVKLSRASSRSKTRDDENITQISIHQSFSQQGNDAIYSKSEKLINLQSTDGSSTMENQHPMNVAWQTHDTSVTKVNASSNNFHTTIRHLMCTNWMGNAPDIMMSFLRVVSEMCISSSSTQTRSMPNFCEKKPTSMTFQRVKEASRIVVALSIAQSSSIGQLQAVSDSCCQFLYSLICFHFCMQVSRNFVHEKFLWTKCCCCC